MRSSTKLQTQPTKETPVATPRRQKVRARLRRGLMLGANFGSALDALWVNRLRY